jgi:DNA-directed RNA polymerase subunit H (RpoH/RPB5)
MSESTIEKNIIQMLVDRQYQRKDESTFYPAIFTRINTINTVIGGVQSDGTDNNTKDIENTDGTNDKKDMKDTKDTIYVYWEKHAIDKKRIILNVQQMRKAKVSKGIVVSKYTISTEARNLFYTLGRDPLPELMKKKHGIIAENVNQTLFCTFELFDEIEFHVNLIKHSLIPRHIALTDSQKLQYLKDNLLSETQLPCILQSDAICRHYGWKRGTLIKIIRTVDDIESLYLRLVTFPQLSVSPLVVLIIPIKVKLARGSGRRYLVVYGDS